MKIYTYDIETFKNFFSVIFIDMDEYIPMRKSITNNKGNLIVSETEKIKAINSVPHETFVISAVDDYERNDLLKLITFINRNIYLAGFNSVAYDDMILKFILINIYKFKNVKDVCKKINDFSDKLVNSDYDILKNDFRYKEIAYYRPLFNSIDLQRIPGLDKIFKSLKQTSINIKWHRVKDYKMPSVNDKDRCYYNPDMPLNLLNDWERYVIKDYIDDIIDYNLNDVQVTSDLFFFLLDDIKLRFNINAKYGIYVLTASDSKLADKFTSKYYCEIADVNWRDIKNLKTYRTRIKIANIISPVVKFNTKKFNDFKEELASKVVSSTQEIKYKFEHDGTTYDIKSGGLHSKDKPGIFESNEELSIRDFDFSSYYPNITITNKISPKHLDKDAFVTTCKVLVKDRLDAKARGDMITAKSLKISINSGLFGKFNFEYGWLYDTKATLAVTINGQLILLMLIERLSQKGIKTISANTDGIVCLIHKHQEKDYYAICEDFIKEINIDGEYTDYTKYVRRDVNNYITIKKVYYNINKKHNIGDFPYNDAHGNFKYDIKRKGSLNQYLFREDLKKGFNMPIIAKAIEEYFVHNIPVRETISKEVDIYNFCFTQNVARKFQLELHYIKNGALTIDLLQKNTRAYVSKRGGLLKKYNIEEDTYSSIYAGHNVMVFNDYFEKPINPNPTYDKPALSEYNIDYTFYYKKAEKDINSIITGYTKNTRKDARKRADVYHTGSIWDALNNNDNDDNKHL